MIQEDFCLDCLDNRDGNVEKGKVIIAYLEIEDYSRDGGESVPCKVAKAECFNKYGCVFFEMDFTLWSDELYFEEDDLSEIFGNIGYS